MYMNMIVHIVHLQIMNACVQFVGTQACSWACFTHGWRARAWLLPMAGGGTGTIMSFGSRVRACQADIRGHVPCCHL